MALPEGCDEIRGLGNAERIDVKHFLEILADAYHAPRREYVELMLRELKLLGVKNVIAYGQINVGGMKVLGKGWASIVTLVETCDGRIAALKILHPKSRRKSLLHEAAMLAIASWAKIAPTYYSATRHAILYEPIIGYSLESLSLDRNGKMKFLLRRLLWKTYKLDLLGISHNELARPHHQVLVDCTMLEPYIIDYESATLTNNPSNLTQLIGGLARIRQFDFIKRILDRLRPLLSQYKKNLNERHVLFKIILGIIISSLDP
jgi:putative serine/threonine protein kinase